MGKGRGFFFPLLFLFITVLLHLSQLSLQFQLAKTLYETNTYIPHGVWRPFAFILLIYSGKTPEVKYSWRYFNTVRFQTVAAGVSDSLRYAQVREVVSFLLAAPETVAQFLLLCKQRCPTVAQAAAVVSASAGPAAGSHAKHLSERLRTAQPSTSHLKDQSWGLGKEHSWKGLLQSWIREVNAEQVHPPCPLLMCAQAQFKSKIYSQAQCCSLQKKSSPNFWILCVCIVPSVRTTRCWII